MEVIWQEYLKNYFQLLNRTCVYLKTLRDFLVFTTHMYLSIKNYEPGCRDKSIAEDQLSNKYYVPNFHRPLSPFRRYAHRSSDYRDHHRSRYTSSIEAVTVFPRYRYFLIKSVFGKLMGRTFFENRKTEPRWWAMLTWSLLLCIFWGNHP